MVGELQEQLIDISLLPKVTVCVLLLIFDLHHFLL